nr:immunoglobulin light chain junction region [Macaca mulatta]
DYYCETWHKGLDGPLY